MDNIQKQIEEMTEEIKVHIKRLQDAVSFWQKEAKESNLRIAELEVVCEEQSAEIERLIDDYKTRDRHIITLLDDPNTSASQRDRVHGKKEVIQWVIRDLEKLLKG